MAVVRAEGKVVLAGVCTSIWSLLPGLRLQLQFESHAWAGLQVDADRNLVYVKGQVPGHKGNWVFVRDAVYKTAADQPPLPWPTAGADQPATPPASPDRVDPFGG